MTFFHFCNCVALAYGPHFIAYKYSSISEYGAFWKCFQVGGVYVLTQLLKMLLLATFFPSSDSFAGSTNLFLELVRTTIDFGDLLGMSFALKKTVGTGNSVEIAHIKILIAGIGWATSDLVLTRALPLWVGARGLQFDWKYIIMSLEANVSLIFFLSLSTLLWLWSRSDLNATLRPVLTVLLTFSVYRHLVPTLVKTFSSFSSASVFYFFFVTSFPILVQGLASLYLFMTYCSQSQGKS